MLFSKSCAVALAALSIPLAATHALAAWREQEGGAGQSTFDLRFFATRLYEIHVSGKLRGELDLGEPVRQATFWRGANSERT